LWVGDVDLDRGTVRVNKAWKRNGEDDATDTPGWLSRQLRAKHTMRDHHGEGQPVRASFASARLIR
jgi:hypothetical protein